MPASVRSDLPFRRRAAARGAALLAALGLLAAASGAHADPALGDPGFFALDAGAPGAAGVVAPKHLYMFGTPYRWSGPLYWRYNDSGRPYTLAKADVIAGINAAAAKWTAACNVAIAQHPVSPETTTPPQTINGTALSPNENVIGWGDLTTPPAGSAATSGVTFTSYRGTALVDADTTYSVKWVTNLQTLQRVAVHELGHALGLAHSNVEGQVMSGPGGAYNPGVPPTEYDGVVDLQPDDVQGCLCLYGPSAANAGKGYLCELPPYRDFGNVAVGATGEAQSVTLRNAASSGNVTIAGISASTPEFRTTGGCAAGTTLAPGASCVFGLAFSPAGAAGTREAAVRVDTGSLGPYTFPVIGTAIVSGPRNYQGLWWKAPDGSESGWGLSFAHQGDTLFATWFTYDTDGAPLWMVVAAVRIGGEVYSGTLYRATGGPPFNAAPFDPSLVAGVPVGTATFAFADEADGTFTATIGGATQTKAITREVFATPAPQCTWGAPSDPALATNYQDMWWNAPAGSESGWGINLAHQGDTIFATWFTYGLDGRPLWLAVSAPKVASKVYAGSLYVASGPAFNGGKFDPAKVVTSPVGTATLTFADGNHATFAYVVNGVAQTKQITREVFAPPGTTCR